MARTRGQNNIAKPIQKFSPSSTTHARNKTKAESAAPSAAAQGSTPDTKSKRKGKSRKEKKTVPAQVEEQPEVGPEEEEDAAGGGPVVSAIRDEREASESLPKTAKSSKTRIKHQKVDVEFDKGPAEAHPAEGDGEASSSGAVEHGANEEEQEPASSGAKTKGKAKLSSKVSRKPATPRKKVTKIPETTRAKAEKDEAHEEDDGAEPSGSKYEANPKDASKVLGKATKPGNRAANIPKSTEHEADDRGAGDKNDEPESAAAKPEEVEAKPKSTSKSAAKSTRTRKKANQTPSGAEKSIVEETDNEPGPSAPKGKSDSKSASKTSPSQAKPSKKVTKPKAAGSKAAQNVTEEQDGESEPPAPTTRSQSKAAPEVAPKATPEAAPKAAPKVMGELRTGAPPASISKSATTKGRKEKENPPVDDTQHDTAGPGEESQDEPLNDSNSKIKKPRQQATKSKITGSKQSADKRDLKKPSPSNIQEPSTAGNRRKRKRPSVGDTNVETVPAQGHQDEAPDNRNSRSKRSPQKGAAPKSAATKVVENSRALARTSTPDDVNDPVKTKPKRGRGRPPKKSKKSAADPESGEGSSAAAKGRRKGRRKPADTTYRHSAEDESKNEDRLSEDDEDHGEEKGSPKKRRRVQDPPYRPEADAWSEPSPVSEHKAAVHPVRDRKSKDKKRNASVEAVLHEAGYANNLLPPSERVMHRSPDFDKRGKLGWRPSSRKKREDPGARRREVTKAAQAETARAEPSGNDEPADDTRGGQPSAPESDQRQDAHGSQTSGSEGSEAEYRSDRIARLRASRRDGVCSRSPSGPSSQRDTTPQPSKRNEPVSQMIRPAQMLPPRRPGDRHFRSQAGPTPQLSGIRGISGLGIPSVQPNTLKRPQKTVGELKTEERQRKRDAKRRRTENPDSTAEETPSQRHPTVSFEDPAPDSQEDEAPQKRGQKRRHSSTVFASITDTRRTRSWPRDNPASRRDQAETDNPPSPSSAHEKPQSESGTSMHRMRAVAIPAMAVRDDAWSEVLKGSSDGSSTAADRSSDTSSSSRTLGAALPGSAGQDSFMDTTLNTAFNMFYRIYDIPWTWSTKAWRDERAKARAAEKKSEREKARKAARQESENRKGSGRVTKSTRSKKPAAAGKGKGKQKETTPEAEAPEYIRRGKEEEEEEEAAAEEVAGQESEEHPGGSMNTRKDSHENVFTISQTTTVKTPPERSRLISVSISPQARQAASILGALEHGTATTAEAGSPRQATPLRPHGGQGGTDPSPRTMQLAQSMADLRQSGDGLHVRNDGGGQSSREAALLGSDFDNGGEERSTQGEAPDEAAEEALREDEVGGLTEDQGTTEDEGREVQTPTEGGDELPLSGRGMFRMAQRLIRKGSG